MERAQDEVDDAPGVAQEDAPEQADRSRENQPAEQEGDADRTEKALLCQRIVEKGLKQSLMIRENPLCQNLTIGKRGRPKNADKILKEKNKRQKLAEEEQTSVQRASARNDGPALPGGNADADAPGRDIAAEASQKRDPEQIPSGGAIDDKPDTFDL